MSRNRRGIFWIFLAALAMTLPTLGVRDIITSHEGRVAQTARQMAAAGWPWNATPVTIPSVSWRIDAEGAKHLLPDPTLPPLSANPWIVPVINGEARLQKPPLPYWVTAVCFKLFGVNEWAARLVPAILWALLTFIVADLAAMLIHPRAAVWAAAVWVSSYFVFDEFRKCMADPYVAFFAIAGVWSLIKATRPNRFELQVEQPLGCAYIFGNIAIAAPFYICLGLGFLAKGPAVFVPVCAGIFAITRRTTRLRSWRIAVIPHVLGLLLFFLIAIPWYVTVWQRVPNAMLLWKYESLGGFGEKNEKPEPFWFYLPQLLLISLPWTFVWVAGIVSATRRLRERQAALIWQGLIVLVFSILTQKKNAYLLPAMAAQTLLIVQGLFYCFAWARGQRKSRQVRRLSAGAAIGLAFPAQWDPKLGIHVT